MLSVWSCRRSPLFCLEPTQIGPSLSRLRDLRLPEPKLPATLAKLNAKLYVTEFSTMHFHLPNYTLYGAYNSAWLL